MSVFNKMASLFYASSLLLMMNCVISFAVNFDNVMTKFIINKRTDA